MTTYKPTRIVDFAQLLMESALSRGFEHDEKIAGAALYASAIGRAYGMEREQLIAMVSTAIRESWE